MDFEIAHVSPDRIDLDDHTYRITTNKETADLALSISAIGLLNPPALIDAQGRLIVISGFRRLAAMKSLDDYRHCVPVRMLPLTTTTMRQAAIAISDNTFQRQLNVVEQSRCYALLRRVCDPPESWTNLANACGLPASGKALKRILPIARMPEMLQQAIVEGSIALPVAHLINEINTDDRRSMIDFLRKITTGLNVQRELFELITEIAKRDGLPIQTLIERDRVRLILEQELLSTPQKAQQIRHLFKAERFPALSDTQKRYQQTLRELRLSPYVQVQPPPFFEGKTYQVTLKVNSRHQLRTLQEELEKLASSATFLPE